MLSFAKSQLNHKCCKQVMEKWCILKSL